MSEKTEGWTEEPIVGADTPMVMQVDSVTKRYVMGSEEIRALDGASLTIRKGEMIAVMGPSGSGKTTLLNMLGCLDSPDSGEIWFDGKNVSSLKEKERAKIRLKKLGFIFQQFYLIPTLTALENVKLPMMEAKVGKKEADRRAKELLATVGLQHREGHKPNQLSGGEQQRVAIARALANNPEILLADEPTGELDTKNAANIVELLHDLVSKRGITVVLVSHDPGVAMRGDRIVHMEDGKIVREENTSKKA
ncbi:MAG: ABC transporter ATP-binding protein [Candidatus Thermoplasmatota archaeon]|nr:ABC transporter ATP-binding protein [Candidatus Thermoplasmatota archaeon]